MEMRYSNVERAVQYAIFKYVINRMNGEHKANYVLEEIIRIYFELDKFVGATCSQVVGEMDGDRVYIDFDTVMK